MPSREDFLKILEYVWRRPLMTGAPRSSPRRTKQSWWRWDWRSRGITILHPCVLILYPLSLFDEVTQFLSTGISILHPCFVILYPSFKNYEVNIIFCQVQLLQGDVPLCLPEERQGSDLCFLPGIFIEPRFSFEFFFNLQNIFSNTD